jgi:hypothetical protein
MDEVLAQMRDIHGPDPVPLWPPAPGWWVVAAALLSLTLLWLALSGWRAARERDWRRDANRRMRRLKKGLARNDSRAVASELSELLRRVAMARYGRAECAGLAGRDWLAWLKGKDPVRFDWVKHGKPLLELPYVPPGAGTSMREMKVLVRAAVRWVERAPRPARPQVLRIRLRAS